MHSPHVHNSKNYIPGDGTKENAMIKECDACEHDFEAKDKWDATVGELKLWEVAEVEECGVSDWEEGEKRIRRPNPTDNGGSWMELSNGGGGAYFHEDTPCRRLGRYEYVEKGKPKYDKAADECVEGKWYEFPEGTKKKNTLPFFPEPYQCRGVGIFHRDGNVYSDVVIADIHTPCREVPAPSRFTTRADKVDVDEVVEFPEGTKCACNSICDKVEQGKWIRLTVKKVPSMGRSWFWNEALRSGHWFSPDTPCYVVGNMVNEKKFVPKE